MTVHTESLRLASFFPDVFHVEAPDSPVGHELWPRMPGVFIRKAAAAVAEPVEPAEPQEPQPSPPLVRELVVGQFGLVPRWVKSASDAKLRSPKLVNARSETVTTSNNLREAWLAGQRCIVPMMAFFEDDFRSGKAVPTRISRVDGQPMGVAGLWESWTGAGGETIVSYTLLTVNANSHALMHRYQQPGSEKRMPAVLNEGGYDAWLNAAHPEKAREFLRAYPANWLTANPVEKK
ncbi:SOS response-associated peptidase [Hydrogenophaga sp. D2P1]|uniref:Abasic site processing protein n=1 Tax=Hydrogenophaga aromaticivorans TaxID=2610898 RepID=A0A7Y8GWI5_9BURK|nr:SOS response-associated peptidase family protein [Hydrogenophaga aromaticivorans]NWF45806.1 SOS response-associated peptidase [Hydrogenophaga aromaticivorans]